MHDRQRGVLLAASGTVLLSTDALMVRLAETEGLTVVFWVGVLTALVTFGAASASERASPVALVRRDAPMVYVAGLLQGASVLLFVLAVKSTSVANVMVIVAAAPLVSAILSWLLIRERTDRRAWMAIFVTAAGIGVVISGSLGGGTVGGDLYAIGAIVSYGLGIVVLRRHPAMNRTVMVGVGGVVMAVGAAWPAEFEGESLQTWLALVAMGAVLGPLARVLLASAPRYLSVTEVALFAPLETVLATLLAFVALDEGPTARTWIGGVVILGGVMWGVWPRDPRAVSAEG